MAQFKPLICSFLLILISFQSSEARFLNSFFSKQDGSNLCNAEKCELKSNWSHQDTCDYVNCNDDACEGGGYLLWTQYVECAPNTVSRVFIIIAAVLYMLLLFLMVSSAADDFFSPSISSIVAHLKISESVAGVTFMAFGNGAPDVFGSIASVLSSPTPKADLALGELFGGGLFVTTMVVSTIILTSPFDVEVFSTIRDLLFYLIALSFLGFCFIFYNRVTLWMPLTFLGLYLLYVLTVFGAQAVHNRKRKAIQKKNSTKSKRSQRSRKSVHSIAPMPVIPEIEVQEQTAPFPEISVVTGAIDKLKEHMAEKAQTPRRYTKRASFLVNGDGNVNHLHPYSKNNHLGISRRESELSNEDEEFVVIHGHVFQGHEARSRAASLVPEPRKISSWQSRGIITDLVEHLDPRPDAEDWEEMNIFSKVLSYINVGEFSVNEFKHVTFQVGPVFLFRLTIPLNEQSWSKPLTLIHAFTCPAFLLFSLQFFLKSPFSGSPGLWLYGLAVSVMISGFLIFFTELGVQPKYYKVIIQFLIHSVTFLLQEIYSYAGFIMSIAWIYLISSEVVNVVTMLGVVSRVSHEVLGLTILAWSNSIGDLIADVSVVKQGYPRMAMAAAIGGPLFNLLMGFGLPFTIAKLQGKYISMTINPTYRLLILFLAISLLATLIGIPVQKFRLQRPHAAVLISIYIAFIVFVLLSETGVLVWN
ncbi:CRE-NCX-7 protein [Caenorhabditis remanei]|uniref:CRE-NCX-7 protein n=1 Tax=Caenorhabditis remanei TaxID=31234 RepID=E3LS94_CAERE|nr:CRE-NCX-7 protein [Caenorhabditis remanei]